MCSVQSANLANLQIALHNLPIFQKPVQLANLGSPSWSIFLVHSPFRESLHEGRPYTRTTKFQSRATGASMAKAPAVLQHHLVSVMFVFKFRPDDPFHVEILQNPAGNLID